MEIRLPGKEPKQISWYEGTTVADISENIKAQLGLPADAVFSLQEPDGTKLVLSTTLPNGLSCTVVDVMVPSVDNNKEGTGGWQATVINSPGGWQANVINSPGASGIVGCGNVMTGRTLIQASVDNSDHSVRNSHNMSHMFNKEKKVNVGARLFCRGDTTSATGGNAIARTAAETDMSTGHQGVKQGAAHGGVSGNVDFSREKGKRVFCFNEDHSKGSHHKDSHNRASGHAKIGGSHNVSDSHNKLGDNATMKHHSTDVNVDVDTHVGKCVVM